MEGSLVLFRLGAFVALLSIACFFGLLPLLLQHLRGLAKKRDRLLALANAFAGGLFLGGGLVSMLGEAIETFELTQGGGPRGSLFALALCSLGFAAAFFAEKVVFHHHHHHRHHDYDRYDAPQEHGYLHSQPPKEAHPASASLYGSFDQHVAHNDAVHLPTTTTPDEGERRPLTLPLTLGTKGHASDTSFAEILVAILSLHSLITGISLGVQQSMSSAVPIFVSLALHKCAEAMALGANLARAGKVGEAFLKPLILFSVMEPVGVLLGWAFFTVLDDAVARVATATLTALAAGTFVYIAIVDILLPEFGPSARDRYLKSGLVRTCICF